METWSLLLARSLWCPWVSSDLIAGDLRFHVYYIWVLCESSLPSPVKLVANYARAPASQGCWLCCSQGLHSAHTAGSGPGAAGSALWPALAEHTRPWPAFFVSMASLLRLPGRGWRPRGGAAGLLFWTHLVKSVTGSSLRPARSGQQPRDQQCPCCSFPSPGDGEGDAGFDVRAQDWGRAVCAHESLAGLQLPLKCSSDQDEREGSPSPNHLALIAGRNASPHPPWGGARRSLG